MVKMKRGLMGIVLLVPTLTGFAQEKQPVDYVNPFIGAITSSGKPGVDYGLGKTFPGAETPFGLVQVSPNTITGGDNGCGYSYLHKSIEGFAFTQMSGVGWFGDLGNFLVTPTTGPLHTRAGKPDSTTYGYRSDFDKHSENATAGYYAVTLDKYKIRAEMTVAPHSGILRFTFPQNSQSRIQIDLARRVGGTSTLQYVKVVDDHTIEGWMQCTPAGGGWGDGAGKANYTVYFFAEFSKPIKDFGVWSADIPDSWTRLREDVESDRYQTRIGAAEVLPGVTEKQGRHLGFYTQFATTAAEQVLMKSGISFVSMENARTNLETEITDWDFDRLHREARARWNDALGKVKVSGGTEEEKRVFYTAMYHSMIDPRVLSDVNGQYPGGDGQTHQSSAFTKHTIFSGWDVFRSQMPLQTIINPTLVNDLINSLVELADENGTHYLERWELLNAYSGCMIGNPAVAVIADAYAKGIRGYNVPKAYQYALNTCERFGNGERGWAYICNPDDHSGKDYASTPFVVSNTLEDAYSEWCLSRLAAALGHPADQVKYAARSESYKNVFDTSVHWFRPRNEDGSWQAWPVEGRLKEFYGTVESNLYQQGWFVPQNIPGMVQLMGGRDKVIADLLNLFHKTPKDMFWNEYYNHSNEPVHHVTFLFNRLGEPWLTQEWSRKVCLWAYHDSVEGLVGNEDVGQMSAWYILASGGLYPICPGDTRYEITSPVFSKVVFRLDPHYATGQSFTIIAHHNSAKNVYIQSARLNGKPYPYCHIDHADIISGGVLELDMGPEPNKKWGI
jgi:predicted alpha-1,2-mannosidase